jgi:putative aldouronate transport system substrate-binding protein
MRKLCLLFLTILIVFPLLANGGQEKAVKKDPLRMLIVGDSAAKSMKENDRIVGYMEDKLGIELTVDLVPQDSWEKVNVAVASGDFPDVVTNQFPSYAAKEWIEDGIVLPLNEYLDEFPALAANAKREEWAWSDGQVYGHLFVSQKGVANGCLVYNGKWLDNLGLNPPDTLDEFYNAMKAFTNNDPDGNGVNDTYGYTSQKPVGNFDFLYYAYGMPYGDWALDKNNKVIPRFEHPSYKKGLTFAKKMWDEGLIDPEFMLNDRDMMEEKYYQGKAGSMIAAMYRHVSRIENNLKKVDPDAYLVFKGGPKGPDGDFGLNRNNKRGILTSVISASKIPEKAAAYINYIASPEGRDLLTLGIEGIHYTGSGNNIKYNEEERAKDGFAPNGWSHPLAWGFIIWPLEAYYLPLTEPSRDRALESLDVATASQKPNLIQMTTDAEVEYGQIVQEIEQQYFMDMLLGKISIDEGIDELSDKWRDQGGDKILAELNAVYKK